MAHSSSRFPFSLLRFSVFIKKFPISPSSKSRPPSRPLSEGFSQALQSLSRLSSLSCWLGFPILNQCHINSKKQILEAPHPISPCPHPGFPLLSRTGAPPVCSKHKLKLPASEHLLSLTPARLRLSFPRYTEQASGTETRPVIWDQDRAAELSKHRNR